MTVEARAQEVEDARSNRAAVHYVLGHLTGVDWGGEPIKRASMACGSWYDQEVPCTEDAEEVTCGKCQERMAEQTEAALKPRPAISTRPLAVGDWWK